MPNMPLRATATLLMSAAFAVIHSSSSHADSVYRRCGDASGFVQVGGDVICIAKPGGTLKTSTETADGFTVFDKNLSYQWRRSGLCRDYQSACSTLAVISKKACKSLLVTAVKERNGENIDSTSASARAVRANQTAVLDFPGLGPWDVVEMSCN